MASGTFTCMIMSLNLLTNATSLTNPIHLVKLEVCLSREKLRFYHVPQSKGRPGWEDNDRPRPSAVPPESLSSATSLLIYNTADNPYAGTMPPRVDALDGRKTKRVQNSDVDEEKSALEAAPVR